MMQYKNTIRNIVSGELIDPFTISLDGNVSGLDEEVFQVYTICEESMPGYNPSNGYYIKSEPIVDDVNKTITYDWVWVPTTSTPEEIIPRYSDFINALIISDTYQSIVIQGLTNNSVNMAYTAALGALTRIENGQGNIEAVRSAFQLLLTVANIPEDGINEILEFCEIYNIPNIIPENFIHTNNQGTQGE